MITGSSFLKEFCKDLPEKPGIYKMIGENGEILYIGKAKNLKKRVVYYYKDELPNRLARMVFLVRNAEYIITKSEAEAFLLEAKQIKLHKPKFNILLKDDKTFPYIKINFGHEYPQIMKFRGKKGDKDNLFGPFASNGDVERTINVIKKIFKIRGCSDAYFSARKRPCLQYQIRRCSAPCVNKISKESYDESVKNTLSFLKGRNADLQKNLSLKMEEYSENLEFEKAAEIRDSIKALSYIQMNSITSSQDLREADVIAVVSKNGIFCVEVYFYRAGNNYGSVSYFPRHAEGSSEEEVFSGFVGQFYQTKIPARNIICNVKLESEKSVEEALFELHGSKTSFSARKTGALKKILDSVIENAYESLSKHLKGKTKTIETLEKIAETFYLDETPSRIEIYDNSHIMGKYAIGAIVVAGLDGLEKNEYRKYTIQTNVNNFGGDDYQMLREVIGRRIKRFKTEPERIPSLMIIDGGKGHLNIVKKIFDENDIYVPFVCMSKGEKRNAGGETFHMIDREFTLDNNLEEMKYLQILRDEVHNFAITSHRKKRSNAISASKIDELPMIGNIRKKNLLNHFGSFAAIKEAGIGELEKVDGISSNIAKKIYDYIREI
jgi:excinuclease ABC subunit C